MTFPSRGCQTAGHSTVMWSFILASVLALSLVTAEEIVTVCRNTYGRSDFLIQVIPLTSASAKRQESAYSGYLDQSGSILRDCRQGSTWRLANAQLSSNGLKVSVSKSTASARFETSLILGVESTKFATSSDFLFWDNVAFDSGTARFCASVGSSGALTAVFKGHIPHDCVPVTLRTVPGRDLVRNALEDSSGKLTSSIEQCFRAINPSRQVSRV